jgi:Phospholipase_D-nuclease N-terminal
MSSGTAGLLPVIVIVVVVAFDIVCLVDLARARQVRYLPRWAWAVVICFLSPWGGLAYLIFRKPR